MHRRIWFCQLEDYRDGRIDDFSSPLTSDKKRRERVSPRVNSRNESFVSSSIENLDSKNPQLANYSTRTTRSKIVHDWVRSPGSRNTGSKGGCTTTTSASSWTSPAQDRRKYITRTGALPLNSAGRLSETVIINVTIPYLEIDNLVEGWSIVESLGISKISSPSMNLQLGWSIVPEGCQKKKKEKERKQKSDNADVNNHYFFFRQPWLSRGASERREEKKGMIGKIGFKTICILYSAQGAKISWAWRGSPRSSLCSTRWGTVPCSTRKERRGEGKKESLTNVFLRFPSTDFVFSRSRISFNQIGGVWQDNPTGIPLTWRWDIFERTPILESVYVVGGRCSRYCSSPLVN